MMTRSGKLGTALAAAALLQACAFSKDHAVFVTKTSIGIDLDTQPSSASFAYDRIEGFGGPRFSNGGLPPVAGFIQTDKAILDRRVRQLYATGDAARAVTGQNPAPVNDDLKGEREAMVFMTGTTTGLKVAFDTSLAELTFGHKRKELSVIPLRTAKATTGAGNAAVSEYAYPPVFASVDNGYEVTGTAQATRADITQFFATGSAAVAVARRFESYFTGLAFEAVAKYREQERIQRQTALDSLYCLSLLPDDKLGQVRDNAGSLKLFPNHVRLDDTKTPAEFRAAYTSEIGITDANSAALTTQLIEHQKFVCKLAGK